MTKTISTFSVSEKRIHFTENYFCDIERLLCSSQRAECSDQITSVVDLHVLIESSSLVSKASRYWHASQFSHSHLAIDLRGRTDFRKGLLGDAKEFTQTIVPF